MPRRIDAPAAREAVDAFARALPAQYGGCEMCALGDATFEPASVVRADAAGVVRVDRFAVAPGHLLVVATRHVERVETLSWREYAAMQRAAWAAARAVAVVVAPRRVWVASLGSPDALPMSSPHVHVHVIPVTAGGDEARPARLLTWSAGVTYYDDPDEVRALAASLNAAWDLAAE